MLALGVLVADVDVRCEQGASSAQIGLNAVVGSDWSKFGIDPYRFADFRRGSPDPQTISR